MSAAAPFRLEKSVALIGLMGSGKSSLGKRLASALQAPFKDADAEIELAAGRTITEIFESFGEGAFRDGERRVIGRLLAGPPHVLATGGGAFCQDETRALIQAHAVSVWLKTDLPILAHRISRKDTRPLIKGKDPLEVLTAQAAVRYPIYAQADIVIETGEAPHHDATAQVLAALRAHAEEAALP